VGVYLRSHAAADHPAEQRIYVGQNITDNAVFTYLTRGIRVQSFSESGLSQPARTGDLLVLSGYTYPQDLAILHDYIDQNQAPLLRGPDLPGRAEPSFLVYRVQE
jgi:hypothetical protein